MTRRTPIKKTQTTTRIIVREPSSITTESYLKKSHYYLGSARLLLLHDHMEQALCMIYYSMFFAAHSLLSSVGITTKRHSTLIFLVQELFGINNASLVYVRNERIEKQYTVDSRLTKREVRKLMFEARQFGKHIEEFIDTISVGDVAKYQKQAMKVFEKKNGT